MPEEKRIHSDQGSTESPRSAERANPSTEFRIKRFRSIDEMMADRREEMLKDPLWLMKQTMRDLRDPYLNYDLPVAPPGETKPVFLPRPVDKEIDQLKAQVQWLTNKITEFRAVKAKPRYKKYQQ